MTASYRKWLPADALDEGSVERMFAAVVEEWSRKWFARRPLRMLGGLRRVPPPGDVSGGNRGWHLLEDGLAIAILSHGDERMAGAMLDLAIEEKSPAPPDQAIIERLAEGCLEDLRNRLSHFLKLPPDAHWSVAATSEPDFLEDAWSCAIGTGEGEAAIRLAVGADLFVALLKRAVRSAPDPILLQPLAEGLARQPVQVSVHVGGCELSLADVAALAEGDVVILDRATADRLDLALDGSSRSGGCTLEHEDGQFRLEVTQPFFE